MTGEAMIADITLGWNRCATMSAASPRPFGLSAALWTHDSTDRQELSGSPNGEMHILAVQQSAFFVEEVRKDGQLTVAGRRLARGSSQLMEAGVRPSAVHNGPWRVLHVYLPVSIVNQALDECDRACPVGAVEWVDPIESQDFAFRRVGDEILAEMAAGLPLSQLRIDAMGMDVAITLLRRFSNLSLSLCVPSRSPMPPSDGRVRRAIDYLEARLAEDVSMAELAQAVGVTATHLANLFRAATGEPPHRWLMRRRFQRACDMLASPRNSVTEVAHACGFASSQHLATVFRKRLGVTPKGYQCSRRS